MSDLAKNVSFLDLVYKMFQNPVLGPAGETYDPLSTFLCQRGGGEGCSREDKRGQREQKGETDTPKQPLISAIFTKLLTMAANQPKSRTILLLTETHINNTHTAICSLILTYLLTPFTYFRWYLANDSGDASGMAASVC